MAKKKIAIVGAGAVGCYAGAHMVQAGEDVTFIDGWPENVEAMRGDGLRITHIRDVEPFTIFTPFATRSAVTVALPATFGPSGAGSTISLKHALVVTSAAASRHLIECVMGSTGKKVPEGEMSQGLGRLAATCDER